jgi:ferritin-like protein
MTTLSRRDLARRGLGAGAALAAAPVLGVTSAFGQEGEDTSDTDSEILIGLVGFEQQTTVAYAAALASGTLGDLTGPLTKFRDQERTHAELLIRALTKIGGKPKPAPRTSDVPGLTQPQNREEYLHFLVGSENQLVAAFFEGQKLLGAPNLLTLVAQISGNVGQHLVVLRQALGADPLPSALPSGSERR